MLSAPRGRCIAVRSTSTPFTLSKPTSSRRSMAAPFERSDHIVVDPASFPWSNRNSSSDNYSCAGASIQTSAPAAFPDLQSTQHPMATTAPSATSSATSPAISLLHIQHDSPLLDAHATPPTTSYAADVSALHRAASLLREGLPVAIPTETVYGLAANATSAEAVAKIYSIKQRPADNPLIVHVSSLDMLQSLYPEGWELPEVYRAVLAVAWPGPLTVLLPRSPRIPECVTCGQPTMAVRMPAHPVARTLIALCGLPLAAPSANSSGRPSPTLASHVIQDLADRGLPLVLDGGPCGCGVESTVLDALTSPPVVLRPGGVTYEFLRKLPGLEELQVYHKHFVDASLEQTPTTPGMKYRHYSPNAMVLLVELPAEAQGGSSADSAPSNTNRLNNISLDDLRSRMQTEVAAQVQSLMHDGRYTRLAVLRTSGVPSLATGPCRPTAWQEAIDACDRDPVKSSGRYASANVAENTVAEANGAEVNVAETNGHLQQGDEPHNVLEYVLGSLEHPESVARELFRALRMVDEAGVGAVIVEGVLEEDEGLAIMNRLRKAATSTIRLSG